MWPRDGNFIAGSPCISRHPGRVPDPWSCPPHAATPGSTVLHLLWPHEIRVRWSRLKCCSDLEKWPKAHSDLSHRAPVTRGHLHFARLRAGPRRPHPSARPWRAPRGAGASGPTGTKPQGRRNGPGVRRSGSGKNAPRPRSLTDLGGAPRGGGLLERFRDHAAKST